MELELPGCGGSHFVNESDANVDLALAVRLTIGQVERVRYVGRGRTGGRRGYGSTIILFRVFATLLLYACEDVCVYVCV